MGGDGIDEYHTGIEVRPSLAFHPLQFIMVRLPDVRHAVDSGGDWTLGHAADGRAEEETKSSQSPLWGASQMDHLCKEPVRHCLRDEAKEVRPGARPQVLKNRRCIRWNTLRIFSGRVRRRWSRIVRCSRTVNVGQAPRYS